MITKETFQEISASEFFYRNRDIAGFANPTRAIYTTMRELVENSLDACEAIKALPEIHLELSEVEERFYKVRIEDNGSGVPEDKVPQAFGQVLYGSKYMLKQQRGTFGLGGKMAILYGQITTHRPVKITSSTGGRRKWTYVLSIDIEKNIPIILSKKIERNKEGWRGTIIEFYTQGDYTRAMSKIVEYLKQTSIINPYATIIFKDPKGKIFEFKRGTEEMPDPPKATLPHPWGTDVEALTRLIKITKTTDMLSFMVSHFQRVGEITAKQFLNFAGIPVKKNPKRLNNDEIVHLANALQSFDKFLPPDASSLSPIGEKLLRVGIQKELEPEFVITLQRKPSAYSGYPFIVEVGLAYGGKVPTSNNITLFRFANKIPLLFDEGSDVSRKVVDQINWKNYKIQPNAPLAAFTHICSIKVPYKTVGKELIADRPEIERELLNGLREAARRLSILLSRKEHIAYEKHRVNIFEKYLPKIAQFSAKLGRVKVPNVTPLIKRISKYTKTI
ncbi:MAG: DNA topoisomerase VI subunit B [Candidatus Bathyarchaeia archaeon]